jgi:hypothetical protein
MMVETQALAARYGRTLAVTASVWRCRRARCTRLGRNGAGKSTLVRTPRQHPPGGHDARPRPRSRRERPALMAEVGVVPEVPDARALDVAARARRLLLPPYPRCDGVPRRLPRALRSPLRPPSGCLSKGQRGQVSLTLALAHRRGS